MRLNLGQRTRFIVNSIAWSCGELGIFQRPIREPNASITVVNKKKLNFFIMTEIQLRIQATWTSTSNIFKLRKGNGLKTKCFEIK